MKSNFLEKIRSAGRTAFSRGIREAAEQMFRYARYKLQDQWEFVYFELPLDEAIFSLTMHEPLVIRPAVRDDIARIESDIYPFLGGNEENDKRHISIIGSKGFKCFIAEKDNQLVHYFLVFDRALESPLMDTPFDKTKVRGGDAYLGSAFTSPHARGAWIFPYSLSKICEYLKNETDVTRALLFVHKDTPGAVSFFQRLGFREIANACPGGPVAAMKQRIDRLWNGNHY